MWFTQRCHMFTCVNSAPYQPIAQWLLNTALQKNCGHDFTCDSMWQLENQRPSIKRCQIACLTACNWGSWADLATLTSTQLSVVTPQASVALLQWVNFHPKNIVFACWWAGDSGTLSDRSFSRERNHPFISMNSFIFSIIILSLVTGWLFSSQTFPCCQYFSGSAPVSCCLRWVLAQQSWIALRLRQTTSTAPPGCEESSPAIKGMRRGTTDFRFEDHSNTCKTYQPVLPKHITSEDGEGDHFRIAHGDVFKCQFNNKNIHQ